MHACVLPPSFNGQKMRANMFAGQFLLFCGTKQPLPFGQKAKAPSPPPRCLPQRGIEWESPRKYFATQRFTHLWHLFVSHIAITCHKVAPTLLSTSLALMLGSTTYTEHCCENTFPERTRKQRVFRGMYHLQLTTPRKKMQISHTVDHRPHPLFQFGPPGPPCHVRGEGEGPPPHKSQATSNPL